MTTTTDTLSPSPDVPLPAGARVIADWDGDSRVIGTDARAVEDTNVGVDIFGCQLPDGSFAPGDGPRIEVLTRCDDPQFNGWGQCKH